MTRRGYNVQARINFFGLLGHDTKAQVGFIKLVVMVDKTYAVVPQLKTPARHPQCSRSREQGKK